MALYPTMYLRLAQASQDKEQGPCLVNIRGYHEDGQSAWVLQQWWASDNGRVGDGCWRHVLVDSGDEPPAAIKRLADHG